MNINNVLFKKFYYKSYEKLIDNAFKEYQEVIKSGNKNYMLHLYVDILNLDTYLFTKCYYDSITTNMLDGLYDHIINK